MKRPIGPKARAAGALAAVILLAAACGGTKTDPAAPDGDDDGLPGTVTYTGHVKALLDANCIRCHASSLEGRARNGAPADVNLDTYPAAVAAAQRANVQIQLGTMPFDLPGGLPAFERALFQRWVDQGTPE